jgi:hypothetical protein
MRKTATKMPAAPVAETMRAALPHLAATIQEVDQAHAVLTKLEVENRMLHVEHAVLLRFAQLAAVRADELATALRELGRDLGIAPKPARAAQTIHTLSKAEKAWIEEFVKAPALALALGLRR